MDFEFDYQRRVDNPFPMEEDHGEEFQERKKQLVSPNKLIIKLKSVNGGIAQRNDVDKKVDDHGAVNGGDNWICEFCRKEFKSGKALGGHMRIHAQQPTSPGGAGGFGRRSYLQDLERDGKLTCSHCNKRFPTPKSLYGHMRCHPDRNWRGMIPPESIAVGEATPSSTIESDEADEPVQEMDYCFSSGVDLLRYLDNWPVKRRRSGFNKSTAAIDVPLDEDEIGAVEALMMLSSSKEHFNIADVEKLISQREEPIQIHTNNTADEIQGQSYKDPDNSKIQLNCANGNTDLEIKKRKRIDPPNNYQIIITNPAPKCYRCNVCNKEFPTPQALGGHKSSAHNKPLLKVSLADPELTLSGGLAVLKPHSCDDPQVSHICKICDKPFPSGQALGGHMRRHWPGPFPATGRMQLVVVSSDQSGSLSAAVTTDDAIKEPVHGFDLNELPDADGSVEQWQ